MQNRCGRERGRGPRSRVQSARDHSYSSFLLPKAKKKAVSKSCSKMLVQSPETNFTADTTSLAFVMHGFPLTVLNLPDELVNYIILLAFRHTQDFGHKFCSRFSPWDFAAVCKQWRYVCLRSPALWTSFRVGSGHRCRRIDEVCVTSQPAIFRCCLQLKRSNPLPIDIVPLIGTTLSCAVPIMMLLAKHSHRWLTFRYEADDSLLPETLSRLFNSHPPTRFSAMQHLHYGCHLTRGEEDFEDCTFRLGPHLNAASLPALRSLRLENWDGTLDTGYLIPTKELRTFLRHSYRTSRWRASLAIIPPSYAC
ncbi:hypothetical protein BDV98DRAFT_283130 [Pterulicium gracile]|uniref:F-box domain-containing protein n=1 Tax=Pterulicium gracile TaxID=1884261 RepID=A0A5C3R2U5_9AGAR|nr:hypothetical protein BDV98DRAFT_283130 [Pterula gracilis]